MKTGLLSVGSAIKKQIIIKIVNNKVEKSKRIKDWNRIFKSITDSEEIAKAKREADKKKRIEERIKDTGL